MNGTTFQKTVWKYLLFISYGEISKKVALDQGIDRMSAQAIGGAVGHKFEFLHQRLFLKYAEFEF